MTGWGRTGTRFACEQAGVAPDILCTSKGITGGSLPLAATLCRTKIFEAHFSTDRSKTFYHSSSYTANPIACAAALANMEVWEREPVAERIAALAAAQEARLKPFENDPRFENVRRCGTIAALDVKTDSAGYLAQIGPKLYAFFQSRNLLLRPAWKHGLSDAALLLYGGGSGRGLSGDRRGARSAALIARLDEFSTEPDRRPWTTCARPPSRCFKS